MNKREVRYVRFDKIPSTNDYAKEKRGEKQDLIVVAKTQTGGRGTKGRSFSSSEGGVYLTKLTFYDDFSAKDGFLIMTNAAVAVCRTLQAFGILPCIKWPNDIYVNGKKICGILIENTFSGNRIANSVEGIGLNVNNRLEKELQDIATTMQEVAKRTFSVDEVEQKLVEELFKKTSIEEYRSYLGFLGERVHLLLNDERIPATFLCVDEEGGLWVEIQGEKKRFTSAEVSVRL